MGPSVCCPYALLLEQCGSDHPSMGTSVISFRVSSSCQVPGPSDICHLVLLVYFVTVLKFLFAPHLTLLLLEETGVTAPPAILSGFCMPSYNLSSCPCMFFLQMNKGPFAPIIAETMTLTAWHTGLERMTNNLGWQT